MANTLFETGRNFFLSGAINWATGFGASGTIQAALITYTTPTAGIKAITGATVATPCVITATSHGFANGDVVLISGVGGTLTANGIFVISGVATNTFQLTDYVTGANVVGVGTYSSGGTAVNLGTSLGGTWAQYSGALVGTPVALTGETETAGVANASAVTFPTVSGSVVSAIALIATASATSGTVASTDKMVAWIDGQQIVTAAAAISAATTLPVERLSAAIPNGTVLSFDDGNSATLTAAPSQFARTVTVSSATVTADARATAPATASGLPVTPNGGNIAVTWDSAMYKIFKL
jgi:hypothetical protein